MGPQRAAQEFIGHKLLDREGNNVGKIDQVYFDDRENTPKWVTVQTGMLGTRHSFVPLEGARDADEDFMVPFDKDTIKDAPHFDAERHLSVDEENTLYRHYGVAIPGPRAAGPGEQDVQGGPEARERRTMDDGMPAAAAGTTGTAGTAEESGMRTERSGMGADDDVTMVRSEEQAHVGVEREESGHARMRKSVETEHFEQDVPVTREEVHIEREPVSEEEMAAGGPRIEDDEQEMTLHAERPVVGTESVPVEKVRLAKDEVTDEQRIQGEVRKERIDVERDDAERGDRRERPDGA